MQKKLVIHIGLPKTGTTSFQTSFFPQVEGYLGKPGKQRDTSFDLPDDLRFLERSLRKLSFQDNWKQQLHELTGRLPFEQFQTIIISEENLSVWKQPASREGSSLPVHRPSRKEAPRRGSHPVVGFLRELHSALPSDVVLLTIVTLRAQKTYLPSQAAQAGEGRMGPIIRRITRRKDEFILWDRLVRDLEGLRGPRKHLTLLFEDGLEPNAREIVRFCDLKPRSGAWDFGAISEKNVRSSKDGLSWVVGTQSERERLRGFSGTLVRISKKLTGGREMRTVSRAYVLLRNWLLKPSTNREVRLSPKQQAQLSKYVSSSNQKLAMRLRRDLKSLGYD